MRAERVVETFIILYNKVTKDGWLYGLHIAWHSMALMLPSGRLADKGLRARLLNFGVDGA